MQSEKARPVMGRGPMARAVLSARIALVALLVQCASVSAATIFDLEKIMAAPPKVMEKGTMAVLHDGEQTHYVRVEYLRNLAEAHKRIGNVSKVQANLAVAIDRLPNAFASPMAGRNVILVTTGMLELIGTDGDMMAALVGHEYAHLYMKHSLRRVHNLPDLVYGAEPSVIASAGKRATEKPR